MKAVHSYPLKASTGTDPYIISMPALAEIIGTGYHRGGISVFALVDPTTHAGQERHFWVYHTEDTIPPDLHLKFIGSVTNPYINDTYHVFEEL